MDALDFVTIGGVTVTAEWAKLFTATEADALRALAQSLEEIRRGYFPKSNKVLVRFIRAKYPHLA